MSVGMSASEVGEEMVWASWGGDLLARARLEALECFASGASVAEACEQARSFLSSSSAHPAGTDLVGDAEGGLCPAGLADPGPVIDGGGDALVTLGTVPRQSS